MKWVSTAELRNVGCSSTLTRNGIFVWKYKIYYNQGTTYHCEMTIFWSYVFQKSIFFKNRDFPNGHPNRHPNQGPSDILSTLGAQTFNLLLKNWKQDRITGIHSIWLHSA